MGHLPAVGRSGSVMPFFSKLVYIEIIVYMSFLFNVLFDFHGLGCFFSILHLANDITVGVHLYRGHPKCRLFLVGLALLLKFF